MMRSSLSAPANPALHLFRSVERLLEPYRGELLTLMTERFHIIDKKDIPVAYREVA